MKCDQIQEFLLTDYLDDCLEKSIREKIDEHVNRCAECKHFKQVAIQTTVDVFKGVGREGVPEDLWGKIKSSLEGESQSMPSVSSWWESFRSIFANPVPVFMLAVLVIFLGLGSVNQWNVHRVKLNQQSKEFLASVMNSSSSILIDDDEGYGTNVELMFL